MVKSAPVKQWRKRHGLAGNQGSFLQGVSQPSLFGKTRDISREKGTGFLVSPFPIWKRQQLPCTQWGMSVGYFHILWKLTGMNSDGCCVRCQKSGELDPIPSLMLSNMANVLKNNFSPPPPQISLLYTSTTFFPLHLRHHWDLRI